VTPASLASNLRDTPHSGIREIANLAIEAPGAIRLEVGQPDFRTPDHIVEAAKRALDEGWHGYTPTAGLPSLRERIADKLRRVNGIDVPADRVVCGVGGVGVISAAVASLVEPGDEVLLGDPSWSNYRMMLVANHARIVRYPCPPELGFLPDLDRLEALVTPRTRLLIVNSPNNPTGRVYPPEVLRRLGEVADRHGLWVISDECYDEIVFDGPGVAPGMRGHADPDRVISCYTFSKTYAMTGWRLGYATGHASVLDSMVKVVESTASGTTTIVQRAAEAALEGPQECVAEMVGAYRRRRDLAVDLLREAGRLGAEPEGAFYVMADVSAGGLASLAFAKRLLAERGVAVAPGSAFGMVADGGQPGQRGRGPARGPGPPVRAGRGPGAPGLARVRRREDPGHQAQVDHVRDPDRRRQRGHQALPAAPRAQDQADQHAGLQGGGGEQDHGGRVPGAAGGPGVQALPGRGEQDDADDQGGAEQQPA
jgi:aspartate aminotransferase